MPRSSRPWRLPLGVALLGGASVALLVGADHLHTAAVVGWAVLVAVAAAGLWRSETRRVASERAVRESRERLHQAQRMEAVGRLAGGIAHDINNYLAGIRTHCELIQAAARRGDLDPGKVDARLEAVVGTVLKASSLVERLLTFGRRQPGHPELVDLNDVVSAFARGFGGGLGGQVRLETRLAGDVWAVEIDLSQLEQALANLVVNARDAIAHQAGHAATESEPRGRIVIATANVSADSSGDLSGAGTDRVALTVSDDGPGIPEAVREQIFDPFFTTKETVGASGLGLATVYAVVEEAGGTIEVGGGLDGRGAGFRIFLPRADRGAERGARPVASAGSASESGGERILLADDETVVRDSAAALLAGHGYRVRAVSGADEAVAAADEAVAAADEARDGGAPFDLLITDVRLGEVAGPELAARLRERGPLRVLYMSGYTDRIALRTGPGRGDAFFLKKPFSGEGLVRMVRELLASRPG